MRILVLVPYRMSAEQLALRQAQTQVAGCGPDVTFEYRPARVAPSNYVSEHDNLLADLGMFEAGMNAEKEGFDAVCVDTVSDAGIAALRSVLDIPVIGPGRTMLLTAMNLGRRFAIVTMWRDWIPLYTKTIKDLGFEHACAAIRSIDMAPDGKNLFTGKEETIIPLLVEAGRRCVSEDGADVLMLGSTTMHQAHAALSAALPVPVINPGPLALKMAESAVRLKLSHSRGAYPRPRVDKRDVFKTMLDAGDK